MRKIQQQFVIVMTTAIVMGISAPAMVIPQAAYANQGEEENSSPLDDCASDEVPAMIDGTMDCLRPEECKSFEIEGKVAKHCNFMMTDE
jgi:hypothetical protein